VRGNSTKAPNKTMQLTLDPDIVVDEFRRESTVLPSFGFCREGS